MKKLKFVFMLCLFLLLNYFISSGQINKPDPTIPKTNKDTVTKITVTPEIKVNPQTIPDEIDTVYRKPNSGFHPKDTTYIPPKRKEIILLPDTLGEHFPKKRL